MKSSLAALCLTPILGLCACSSQVSTAKFCADVNSASVQFAALQSQATPSLVHGAAKSMAHLAEEAPSPIKSAVQVEAAAYQKWAKTGSNVPLTGNAFSAADDQLSTWLQLNCKGR